MSLAVEGRLEMNGPRGDAVLAGSGDRLRLSIDSVRAAMTLLTLRMQLRRMSGITPRAGDVLWPPMDIEIHGWRVARLTNGRTRPALPIRCRSL